MSSSSSCRVFSPSSSTSCLFEVASSGPSSSSRCRVRVAVSSSSNLSPNCRVCVRDMRSSLSSSSRLVSVRVRARKPGKVLSECSRTPHGSAPGGTLETLPRDHPRTPGRDPEKDPSVQVVNYQPTVGNSSRKCRVAPFLGHSPISLTLPLSSFGWLRNNSSSHRSSASFRNHT